MIAVELAPRSDFAFAARSAFRSSVARDAAGALADAERSLSISPDYAIARSNRGGAYALLGDFARAIEEFRAATPRRAADPMWSHRACFIAVAQCLAGDHDRVAATLRELIDLRPSVRAYRRLLAHALRQTGEMDEAERQEAEARRLSGKPTYHVHALPLSRTDAWILDLLAPDVAPEASR